MFLEHRLLYRLREANAPVPGPGLSTAVRRGPPVSRGPRRARHHLGAPVYRALEAANALAAEGVETEILDLRTIAPWDAEAVFEAVRRIGKVLIVHEDTATCGFGAELAAQIAEHAFGDLDGPVMRVTMADIRPRRTRPCSTRSCPLLRASPQRYATSCAGRGPAQKAEPSTGVR